MATIIVCDKCKTQMTAGEQFLLSVARPDGIWEYQPIVKMDICKACLEKFVDVSLEKKEE